MCVLERPWRKSVPLLLNCGNRFSVPGDSEVRAEKQHHKTALNQAGDYFPLFLSVEVKSGLDPRRSFLMY